MSEFFAHPTWQRLAWVLVHATWQIAVVGIVAWWLLAMVRPRRAGTRYLVAVGGLALMAVLPLVTFHLVEPDVAVPASVSAVGTIDGHRVVVGHPTSVAITPAEPIAAAPVEPDWFARLRPWMLSGWLVGVALFGLRLGLGLIGVGRLVRSGRPLPNRLVPRVAALRSRLGLSTRVAVAASQRVAEAVAVGFLRPMVLVPTSWLAGMPTSVLEAIVAHELAHVRRWDLWVNLFQRVVETLLFFHPFVWWLSGRARAERELCCDELAVSATGERAAYARALEFVASRRVAAATPLVAAGWGGSRMQILQRVRNVLGLGGTCAAGTGWWPVALGVLAIGVGTWIGGPSISTADDGERERESRVREEQAAEKYERIVQNVKEAVKAGRLTEEQAKEKLKAVEQELKRGREGERDAGSREKQAAEKYEKIVRDVKGAVKEGRLTEEQAKEKLKAVEQELKRGREGERDAGSREKNGAEKFEGIARELKAAVKAGKLTEEQAREKLEAVEQELKRGREGDRGGDREQEVRRMRERLANAVKQGELTEAQAKEKWAAIERELAAGEREQGKPERGDREHGDRERHAEELRQIGAKIREAVREGKLTEEQAREKLEALGGERGRPGERERGDERREGAFRGARPAPEVRELMEVLGHLRREVEELRREVRELRGDRPPVRGERPPFGGDRPPVRDGRPPVGREGDRPRVDDPRGEREGDRPRLDRERPRFERDRPGLERDRPLDRERREGDLRDRPRPPVREGVRIEIRREREELRRDGDARRDDGETADAEDDDGDGEDED